MTFNKEIIRTKPEFLSSTSKGSIKYFVLIELLGYVLLNTLLNDISNLSGLPKKILISVLSFCNPKSIEKFRTTCSAANKLCLDVDIWDAFARTNFGYNQFKRLWNTLTINQNSNITRDELVGKILVQCQIETIKPKESDIANKIPYGILHILTFEKEPDDRNAIVSVHLYDLMCSSVVGLYRYIEIRYVWACYTVYQYLSGLNRVIKSHESPPALSRYCHINHCRTPINVRKHCRNLSPSPIYLVQLPSLQICYKIHDLYVDNVYFFVFRQYDKGSITVVGRFNDGAIKSLNEADKHLARNLLLHIQ